MSTIARLMFAAAVAAVGLVPSAQAGFVLVGPGSFTPQASVITFSEQPLGTLNPVYNLMTTDLGPVTVSFGTSFLGQSVIGGAVRTLTGTPSGPLTLAPITEGNFTQIVGDSANPTSPVLSGNPIFNGPVSVLFSVDVAAVGLDGGFFDAIGGTSIQAYDRNGNVLGTVTNSAFGIEFFGLADDMGLATIAGISFFITGNEPAGFAIDNLTFGSGSVLVNPTIGTPVPATALMAVFGVVGLGFRRLRV